MNTLRGYKKSISQDIGVTDICIIAEVEDIMRHEVFHSTLDWQSREQFKQGAIEAYAIYKEIVASQNGCYMS